MKLVFTSRRNSWVKNTIIRTLLSLMACIIVAMGALLYLFLGDNGIFDVFANPNKCPQNQVCKWVQHQGKGENQYGKCQWLPVQAVAWPWVPVPENTCPQPPTEVVVVSTPTQTATRVDPSPTKVPTSTLPAVVSTCTPSPVPAYTSTAVVTTAKATNDPSKVLVLTATLTPKGCDECAANQRMADALATLADIESTRFYREVRP